MEKKHHISILVGATVAAAVIAVLFVGLGIDQKRLPTAVIGQKAFAINAQAILDPTTNEKATVNPTGRFELEQFKGKTVVLNFWASWCVSCRSEAHELQTFWEKYRDRNVVVLGVAVQDTAQDAIGFAKRFGKSYYLGLDDKGHGAIDYGVTGVPETFIIGKDGLIKYKEVGPVTEALLIEKVEPLLKENL